MGLAYSMLASSLWPLIALVTPEYQLGTAYGIAQAVQNLGLAVVSILAGIIVDHGGYFMLEMFFLGWLWISLITAVAIWVSDVAITGGYLNMTPSQREKYEQIQRTPESLEREKLLTSESTSDLSTDDQPQSDISIRNRYLSRIGGMFLEISIETSYNRCVFNESSSKIQKYEDNQQNIQAENADKGNINLQQQRKSLPVYKLRKRLLEEIRRNSTLIIIGETGSGKTTQIPQLLLSSGIAGSSGCVGVTQPRRVAAESVARRVALEQGVETGKLVGYCVRFEDVTSSQTRIKYLTDGMMVREAMTDEILSDYSVVILDEAHERSVQTDVLLGVARRAQNLRKLKNRR
ncbi:hypothetical protein K0M31_019063 [Melipona bicolor]|uniref:RNA helicase n=1 Tax=Melipona bicolor TaxID=60889 RepID=A0AA40FCF8_9HYME|nr:hypothetical protein K0M31_019063 [Melipona bicolor]